MTTPSSGPRRCCGADALLWADAFVWSDAIEGGDPLFLEANSLELNDDGPTASTD